MLDCKEIYCMHVLMMLNDQPYFKHRFRNLMNNVTLITDVTKWRHYNPEFNS